VNEYKCIRSPFSHEKSHVFYMSLSLGDWEEGGDGNPMVLVDGDRAWMR